MRLVTSIPTACPVAGTAGLAAVSPSRVAAEPFPVADAYAVNGAYTAVSDDQ
jgi:hypothetical protein